MKPLLIALMVACLVGAIVIVWLLILRKRRGRPSEHPAPVQSYVGPIADLPPFQAPIATTPPAFAPDYFFVGADESVVTSSLSDRQQLAVAQRELIVRTPHSGDEGPRWGVPMQDGRSAVLFDRPVRRSSAERSLRMLINARENIVRELGKTAPLVDLHWPSEILLDFDQGIDGYVCPELPGRFVEDGEIRTLDTLSRRQELESLHLLDRLELVRVLAAWLAALHSSGVIFGKVEARNIAYSVDPIVICPLDFRKARSFGQGAWTNQPGEGMSSFGDDREKFSELARQIIGRAPASSGQQVANNLPTTQLLTELIAPLDRMLRRAAGPPGTMPTMQEWLAALDDQSPNQTRQDRDHRPIDLLI